MTAFSLRSSLPSGALLAVCLGLSHAVNDSISGYAVGRAAFASPDASTAGLQVLAYNVLAFGGQLPVGWVLDARPRLRAALALAFALTAAGLGAASWGQSWAAVLALGLGSAVFHVAGGAYAARVGGGQAKWLGVFAAPGVIGLALGGVLAHQEVTWAPWLLGGVLLVTAAASLAAPAAPALTTTSGGPQTVRPNGLIDSHDVMMMVLLLAIALRSVVWNVFQYVADGERGYLIGLAVAAVVGKLLGGLLADRLGARRFALAALGAAAVILTFGHRRFELLCLGVGLLQAVTPAAYAAMIRLMPQSPATATALVLGTAIALGGVPFQFSLMPVLSSPWFVPGCAAVAWALYAVALRRRQA